MNERKTKGWTNLNSDEKITRDTCVSLARMYFSQFAAISCLNYVIQHFCCLNYLTIIWWRIYYFKRWWERQRNAIQICHLFPWMRPSGWQYNWKHFCGLFLIPILSKPSSHLMYPMISMYGFCAPCTWVYRIFKILRQSMIHNVTVKCC